MSDVLGHRRLDLSTTDERLLIVGAGPTGLAAALFLDEAGIRPRIVERQLEPSRHSKALGVNARTLELLERSGVTGRLLAQGHRAAAVTFWRHGRKLGRVELAGTHPRYPFMLIHAQSRSERLLEDALAARGIEVERGVTCEGLSRGHERTVATLEDHGDRERCEVDRILGADGPHSQVRKAAGIAFDGTAYPEPWQLYDLELDPPLDGGEGHVFMLDDGGMFVVRVEGSLWRVIGRSADGLLDHLPSGTSCGAVAWESGFHIAHRLASSPGDGEICLAGDAAHIHSPLGGRGMNLGIEDAFVWARLAADGRLQDYAGLRAPVHRALVRTIARMTEIPRGLSLPARAMRPAAPLLRFLIPLLGRRLGTWALGLDHPAALR